jgi:hypothetical protein
MFQKTFAAIIFLSSTSLLAQTNIQLKNDFRFRTENIKEEQAAPLKESDRTRQRLRLRLGGTAQVNEKTKVTARVSTGTAANTDGNTTNQDLTDYYSKKTVVLDLAHFEYAANENLMFAGGKTPNYFLPNSSADLVFDADLTPEGMALKYKKAFEGGNELYFNTGASWLNERFSATGATDNTDVGLVAAQLGGLIKLDSCSVNLYASQFNFSNIKGATAPAARGNTLTGGAYQFDYKLTVLETEISTTVSEIPTSVFYQLATNSDPSTENRAAIIGLKLGKLKDADSWMIGVDYREVEKDAVVGVLSESDSSGGGSDIRSTRLVAGYQLAANTNIMATLLTGKRVITSTTLSPNYQRLMLDFNFGF